MTSVQGAIAPSYGFLGRKTALHAFSVRLWSAWGGGCVCNVKDIRDGWSCRKERPKPYSRCFSNGSRADYSRQNQTYCSEKADEGSHDVAGNKEGGRANCSKGSVIYGEEKAWPRKAFIKTEIESRRPDLPLSGIKDSQHNILPERR